MNRVGTWIDQKYFVVNLLEENEVAVTYRIWHVGWETSLTMKLLRKNSQRLTTSYGMTQAQEWVDLGIHPNIISAYFYREIEENLFLFLESSSGIRLVDIMAHPAQNFSEVLPLLLEIAHGMAYLQDEGISHGTLCPENIVLDKHKRVKLNQIRWNSWETLEILAKGMRPTPGHFWENSNPIHLRQCAFRRLVYQPPEYFLQKTEEPNVKSDIYAFGVLAYELVYGRPPFELEDDVGNLFMAFRKRHQQEKQIQNWSPPGRNNEPQVIAMLEYLQPIISSCLQYDPQERPTHFSDLTQILLGIYSQTVGKPYIFESFADNMLMAMSLNNQALGCIDQGILGEADKILQEVVNLHSNSIVAPINRRLLKLRRRNISPREFLQQIRKYEAMSDVRYYILCGKICLESGSLIQQTNDLLAKLGIHDEQVEMVKADLDYRLGDFQHARDLFKSLAYKSSNPSVWYRWGASSFAMKLNKEAQAAWEKGLTLDMPLWDLIIGYSMLLAVQGQWAKARRYLEDAAKNFGKYLRDPTRFDTVLWSQVRVLASSQPFPIIDVAIIHNKHCIIGRASDGTTYIWDWPSGKKLDHAPVPIPAPTIASTRFLHRQPNPEKPSEEVVFSSNGQIALKIKGTNTIQLWTLAHPDDIINLEAHSAPVVAIAIMADGQLAVSSGMDRTLKVWHLSTRKCLGSLMGHQDCVHCLAISDNGRRAVTASWDRTVRVWDLANFSCVATFIEPQYQITAVAIRSDGEMIITANTNRQVKAWDVASRSLLATLQGQEQAIYALAVSSDGQMILSAGQDGTVAVYEDIGQRACPLETHAHYFLETLPSPLSLEERQRKAKTEEDMLFSSNQRKFNLVFDHYHNLIQMQRHFGSPEITLIMAQNLSKMAQKYGWQPDVCTGIELVRTFVHDSALIGFFLAHPEYFFSLTSKGTLWRSYLHNTKCDFFWQKFSFNLQAMDFCLKNQRFAFLTKDGEIALWNIDGDRWGLIEAQGNIVYSLRMTTDGLYALAGTHEGRLQFWDLEQEYLIQEIPGHEKMVSQIFMLSDHRAVTGSVDGSWIIWDLNQQKMILSSQQKYAPIWAMDVCGTENPIIVAGLSNGYFICCDTHNGDCHVNIKASKFPITAISACNQGQLVLLGTQDGHLMLWHTPTQKLLVDIFAHQDAIQQVYLSPDGNWAFSASLDATIKAWKLNWHWQHVEK